MDYEKILPKSYTPILRSADNGTACVYYRNINHVQMTEFSSSASEICKKNYSKYVHRILLRSIKARKKLYKTSLRWNRIPLYFKIYLLHSVLISEIDTFKLI